MFTVRRAQVSVTAVRSAKARLVAVASAGAMLGFLFASQGASGYGVNYCAGWLPSGGTCQGPSHTLTANIAYDGTGSNAYVCETATTASGRSIGGWGCGYGYAETCYAGNQLLRGWIANGSPYWLYMNGTEYYAQGCP